MRFISPFPLVWNPKAGSNDTRFAQTVSHHPKDFGAVIRDVTYCFLCPHFRALAISATGCFVSMSLSACSIAICENSTDRAKSQGVTPRLWALRPTHAANASFTRNDSRAVLSLV